MEEASVHNLYCWDGEIDFWDRDSFGSLAMELGYSWERHFGSEWWHLVKWRMILIYGRWIFVKQGQTLIIWRGGIWIGRGSIVIDWTRIIWMNSLRVACLVRVMWRSRTTLR